MSFIGTLFGIKTIQNDAIKVLSPTDFKQEISGQKRQLVDVRTLKEFKSGHIKGAKNIDFFSTRFYSEFEKLNKDTPVYIYCRSGSRSRQASKKLIEMGFIMIYDLKGGILNYN
jgi:rhodanese-related sulfurtransferase